MKKIFRSYSIDMRVQNVVQNWDSGQEMFEAIILNRDSHDIWS